jgi:hypothetical protein
MRQERDSKTESAGGGAKRDRSPMCAIRTAPIFFRAEQAWPTTRLFVWCNLYVRGNLNDYRKKQAIGSTACRMAHGGDMKKIVCVLLALCLVACGKSEGFKSGEPAALQGSVVAEAEFDLTPDQFADAFNAAAKSTGRSFRINKNEIMYGAIHDYFEQPLSDSASLTVGLSRMTGRVTGVTALVAEQNGKVDMYTVRMLAEIIMMATAPELSKKKSADVVADVMKEAADNKDARIFPQRFFNHVRYALRNSSGIGYWWVATPT